MDHEAFFLGAGLELSIYRWGRIWAERVKQSFSKEKKIGYRKSQGATSWMRWKDVFPPATVKCSLHPPTLKCPGALWSPMLWGTTIGAGGSGWDKTTCPDIPMKVSCPAVNLLISLFSAWLTVHVGVLYIEWNPAGSHCSSFSGVFQYPFTDLMRSHLMYKVCATIDRPCLRLTARWSLPYEDIEGL